MSKKTYLHGYFPSDLGFISSQAAMEGNILFYPGISFSRGKIYYSIQCLSIKVNTNVAHKALPFFL